MNYLEEFINAVLFRLQRLFSPAGGGNTLNVFFFTNNKPKEEERTVFLFEVETAEEDGVRYHHQGVFVRLRKVLKESECVDTDRSEVRPSVPVCSRWPLSLNSRFTLLVHTLC